ncbi:hypothetical protein [Vallitalea guaymasensis]|uniref:Uncharacterized protein n=1 Tax=Vallitalea guaymasensis TaxID=1185412 RepID=A0A8J8M7L2_9FIRM|nr:hypothetical protein [Vallitalea guaymasensis]QUH27796.1 hypothetical protein HYG85_02240 [Vallitalea guaymasensis]
MTKFYPIYRGCISTDRRPSVIQYKIEKLIKKKENTDKIQIHTSIDFFSKEEYSGYVNEKGFKLKRYKYLKGDPSSIVYRGNIVKEGKISKIYLKFYYPFIYWLVFLFLFTQSITSVVSYINGSKTIEQPIGFIIGTLVYYFGMMAGFNYRTKKVKALIEHLLNNRKIK